jgi:hypothetical protein
MTTHNQHCLKLEKTETISSKVRNKTRLFTQQEDKRKNKWDTNRQVKLSQFENGMILCLETLKTPQKTLRSVKHFWQSSRIQINIQK